MYICECGKEFDNPQKFNGHKQGCKVHLELKYGSIEAYYAIKNRGHAAGVETKKKQAANHKAQREIDWISEQHTCERCGKVMTEKYGSGRFCSRSCANSREFSVETNLKRSKTTAKTIIDKNLLNYQNNPNFCVICNQPLPYSKRFNKTCCKACKLVYQSDIMKNVIKESGLHLTAIKKYKYGFYNGIECDSSWELAYVLYELDHGKNVIRNTDCFPYTYNNEIHSYFPDFIVDNVYVEIKGYYDDVVKAKVSQFPKDLSLNIIDKTKISIYLDYAINTYGKDFWKLYDKDKKSCNNLEDN